MTSSQDQSADHDSIFAPEPSPARVRATSTSGRRTTAYDRPQAAVTTAEIPVVRAPRPQSSSIRYGVARPGAGPQIWRSRPDAAPAPLRLFVWTLFFLFILLFVGLVTLVIHPTWLSFLRNTVPTPHTLAAFGRVTGFLKL